MAITDQTRKRLWVKSGNRCAICKARLLDDPTGDGGEHVIGQECHICSSRPSGPRHDPTMPPTQVDDYANLVLLSPDCHTVVDGRPDLWPACRLRQQKTDHERWVAESLELQLPGGDPETACTGRQRLASRLTTGAQLLNLLATSQAHDFSHDELSGDTEAGLVASFLQSAEDWSEIASQIPAGDAVHAARDLSAELSELDDCGLWVFGCRYSAQSGQPGLDFQVACLRVVHADSPAIAPLRAGPGTSQGHPPSL